MMGIISWIIIGALAGWIASMFTGNNKSMGAGAGFNIWSLIVSVIGSVILLSVINAMKRQRE